MNLRMVNAEFLKLRKRWGLVAWTFITTLGVVILLFGVSEGLHLGDAAKHGPAGGVDGLRRTLFALSAFGGIAAILVGVTAGSGDISAGVFRELVATGRPRWQLFVARVPGALLLILPAVALAYALAAVCVFVFADALPTPDGLLLAKGLGFVLLAGTVNTTLAIGLASVMGSRGTAIGVLLGWQLVAEPLLSNLSFLGSFPKLLHTNALFSLSPLLNAERATRTVSTWAALAILAVWLMVALGAGAWRTARRDA